MPIAVPLFVPIIIANCVFVRGVASRHPLRLFQAEKAQKKIECEDCRFTNSDYWNFGGFDERYLNVRK